MENRSRSRQKTISEVQINLNAIQTWCHKWGFVLSNEKSKAIIFGRTNKSTAKKLNIDGSDLQWQTEVKFLGMILDERLNWNSHIDYVSGRCQKRINLMRCLSGTNWGANKRSLLHIYKATIRSVLEYGSAAFNSATPTVKAKLDKIQAQALRIACGAMKSTSIASL